MSCKAFIFHSHSTNCNMFFSQYSRLKIFLQKLSWWFGWISVFFHRAEVFLLHQHIATVLTQKFTTAMFIIRIVPVFFCLVIDSAYISQMNLVWHSFNPSFFKRFLCATPVRIFESFFAYATVSVDSHFNAVFSLTHVTDCQTKVQRSRYIKNILRMVNCFRLRKNLGRMLIR